MTTPEQAREALEWLFDEFEVPAHYGVIDILRGFVEQAQQAQKDTARLDSGLIMMGGCLVSGLDLRAAIDSALAAQGAARGESA